jgi:hypothetical protein
MKYQAHKNGQFYSRTNYVQLKDQRLGRVFN